LARARRWFREARLSSLYPLRRCHANGFTYRNGAFPMGRDKPSEDKSSFAGSNPAKSRDPLLTR
jgi:hypothetical protein